MNFEVVKVGSTKEDEKVSKGYGYNEGSTRQRGTATPATNRVAAKDDQAIRNGLMDIFVEGLSRTVEEKIEEAVVIAAGAVVEELDAKIAKMEQNRIININIRDRKTTFEGRTHKNFTTFLKALSTGAPVMLVGPAGTGKTFAAEQSAQALDVPFYAMSVGVQTSKSDIGGYMSAVGEYVRSQFREAYENGGVFLMDEIDAGNSNVLIFINAALSGSQCAFPDQMIKKHKDFYFVATGNTYGTGASRQYVGRNQLDAATLDRFVSLDWPIDEDLEFSMVESFDHGKRWIKVVRESRKVVEDKGYRLIISPRATLKGVSLLEAGLDFDTVLSSTILAQANEGDQRRQLSDVSKRAWG